MAGARMAFSAGVRPFVILPAVVSLIVIGAGLTLVFSYVAEFASYLTGTLPDWLSFLGSVLKPLLYLFGLLTGAWSFGLIATIVGSPFLGELSKRVDKLVMEPVPWWREIAPALLREMRKLRYHLPRLLMLVVVSFVPVVNALAPFLWLGFGAWMMAVQFCDYSTENRSQNLAATLSLLANNRAATLGFGACVTVAMSVPVLNFMVAPVAVIGGTLLMQSFRTEKDKEIE